MKKILFMLSCMGLFTCLSAQQLSRSVISPGGTSSKGATITLDWTLGDLAVRSLLTTEGLWTEGFHQPMLSVEEIFDEPVFYDQVHIQVAPNPVRSFLSVKINSDLKGKAIIDLWDLQGKHLQRVKANLSHEDMEWDMTLFPSAMYTLSFRTEKGELIRTFKVRKIH